MNFAQYVKVSPILRIDAFAFINLALLILAFLYIVPVSLGKPVMLVKLPKVVTSDMLNVTDLTVVVTGENILFINNRIITLQELRNLFVKRTPAGLFIKVDRRASVGRVVDIWDIARATGIKRINVASDQEE